MHYFALNRGIKGKEKIDRAHVIHWMKLLNKQIGTFAGIDRKIVLIENGTVNDTIQKLTGLILVFHVSVNKVFYVQVDRIKMKANEKKVKDGFLKIPKLKHHIIV